MSVEGKVEGPRKSTMDVALSQLGYDKNGNLLRFVGASTPTEQTEETTPLEDSDDTSTESTVDGGSPKKHQQQLDKINSGITKMDGAKDRVSSDKLLPNIERYEQALKELRQIVEADETMDGKAQKEIEKAEQALTALRQYIENMGGSSDDWSVKKRQNKAKIKHYSAQLDKLAQKLGIS